MLCSFSQRNTTTKHRELSTDMRFKAMHWTIRMRHKTINQLILTALVMFCLIIEYVKPSPTTGCQGELITIDGQPDPKYKRLLTAYLSNAGFTCSNNNSCYYLSSNIRDYTGSWSDTGNTSLYTCCSEFIVIVYGDSFFPVTRFSVS
ncbi:hypothetical protein D915_010997 [Fasciola hepatica]|uniref:Uncharacterized protein n=1 Tax=Fasciola hepatica TaxID=6192 RepID=A0A4E0QUA4_FASHE|nr:hypothetical protein D915_010996 [Fasciola hepatica]THD18493.1 hypothetical protein D915_010997 [Fasciola hepatica]